MILNIQDNHVRTMNEEKRNCEHLHRFPAPRRAGGICPGRSPGEKIENNTAQSVERVIGNDEVGSSNLPSSSKNRFIPSE